MVAQIPCPVHSSVFGAASKQRKRGTCSKDFGATPIDLNVAMLLAVMVTTSGVSHCLIFSVVHIGDCLRGDRLPHCARPVLWLHWAVS